MNLIFEQAFEYVIGNEGQVYTNNPRDRGGPTKYGVTLRSYEEYIGRLVEISDIQTMTKETAKDFYFNRYWRLLSCDKLTKMGVAIPIFDAGVLYGIGTAAKLAQRAVSLCGATVKLDGILGDKSIAVLNNVGEGEFIRAFQGLLLVRIDSIIEVHPGDEIFRNGWTNRANRLASLVPSTKSENLA